MRALYTCACVYLCPRLSPLRVGLPWGGFDYGWLYLGMLAVLLWLPHQRSPRLRHAARASSPTHSPGRRHSSSVIAEGADPGIADNQRPPRPRLRPAATSLPGVHRTRDTAHHSAGFRPGGPSNAAHRSYCPHRPHSMHRHRHQTAAS